MLFEQRFGRKPLRVAGPKHLDLLKWPLGLGRRFELFSNLERLLIACLFRRDPALRTVLITETGGPILRFRMFPNACHG